MWKWGKIIGAGKYFETKNERKWERYAYPFATIKFLPLLLSFNRSSLLQLKKKRKKKSSLRNNPNNSNFYLKSCVQHSRLNKEREKKKLSWKKLIPYTVEAARTWNVSRKNWKKNILGHKFGATIEGLNLPTPTTPSTIFSTREINYIRT